MFPEAVEMTLAFAITTPDEAAQLAGELIRDHEFRDVTTLFVFNKYKAENWVDFVRILGKRVITDKVWASRPDIDAENTRRDNARSDPNA